MPNTAFTEALAFVFQNRDLELLGLSKPTAESQALKTLNDFWGTYEIAGVALVDMAMWHWMYDHPNAGSAELKGASADTACMGRTALGNPSSSIASWSTTPAG